MNKTTIKNKAALKGYATTSETETALVFTKDGKKITIDSLAEVITTEAGGKKGYNFVTADTIDAVSKFLLK